MNQSRGNANRGKHISEPGCHGNGVPSRSKVKQASQSRLPQGFLQGEITDEEDEVYNDAISEVNTYGSENDDLYGNACSNISVKMAGQFNVDSEMAENSEISLNNSTVSGAKSNTSADAKNIPLLVNEPNSLDIKENDNLSLDPELEDSLIYDDAASGLSSIERLTESYSASSDKRKIGNPGGKDFDFISSTQSLPPNINLSSRTLGISQAGDTTQDTLERIQRAKRKSLTMRRTPSDSSPPSGLQYENNDGDIYESIYLQLENEPTDINNEESDSDDVSWSSDEFESYEDSIHNEADAPIPIAIPDIPASGTRKIHFADGTPETSNSSLIRRIKESFRASSDTVKGQEDSPYLPVQICDIKHPPPVLPPLPSGLNQNQVKRRHAVGVLINTEKSYINSLQRLLDDFRKPLLEVPLLSRGKVRIELMRVEEILQYHQMFQIELAEQVKLWHTQERIGDVFTASFSKSIVLDAYSEYVNNFSAAMEEIKKVTRQRASLRDYLKMKESQSSDRLGLFGLMVKPVQRFPQFITGLQDLLKYTPHAHHDRLSLQRALTELENIAHKLNERKGESEQQLEAKGILSKFKETVITRTSSEPNRRLIREDDFDQVIEASNRFKKRRLILLNDMLISATVIPGRDMYEPERYKLKWCFPLRDVELKESSLSSSMQSSVRGEPGMITVVFAKPENPEEDPFNLVTDLSELHHDYSVLSQVVGLVSTLKRSYTGLSEESVHSIIRDLQRLILMKEEQLRLVKSCSITLSVPCRTVTGSIGRTKYVFHTQSPSAKQDWCLDLQIAKMALDAQNNPGWDVPVQANKLANQMPALFIKALPVDVVRHYTKVRCAVPVFLSTPSNIGVGMQHLWVCNTTDTMGQVSIVSIHADRPRVIESYKACDCQILCVENVPGYATTDSPYAFLNDTVWMVTAKSQVLIYQLISSDGMTKRQPSATFTLSSNCGTLRYADDHMFVALDNGQLAIYSRNEDGVWNISEPDFLKLSNLPLTNLLSLEDHVICTTGNWVHFISLDSLKVEISQRLCSDDSAVIGQIARAGVGLWVAYENQPLIHLYHLETLNQLQDVNVSSAIHKALSSKLNEEELKSITKDVRVSCLLASKGLLWIGTNKGAVLSLPLPRLREGVPQIGSRPCVSFHGHCGPVRFLLPIFFMTPEGDTLKMKSTSKSNDSVAFRQTRSPVRDNSVAPMSSVTLNPNQPTKASGQNGNKTNTAQRILELNDKVVQELNNDVFSKSESLTDVSNQESNNSEKFNPVTPDLSLPGQGQGQMPVIELPVTLSPKIKDAKPISFAARKNMWKSTPNLAADVEGTEDISVLYGSLMRGLDKPLETAGVRRKNKWSQAGKKSSFTLGPSSALQDGSVREKGKNVEGKRFQNRMESDFRDSCSMYEFAGPCTETTDDMSPSQSDSKAEHSKSVSENVSNSLKQNSHSPSVESLNGSANEGLVDYPKNIPQRNGSISDIFTSARRRSEIAGESTLRRNPVQSCKSVIVVSGGDGYCYWNQTENSKGYKNEEATLLLWLYKVIS